MSYIEIEDSIARVSKGPLSLKESYNVFKKALQNPSYSNRVQNAIGTTSFDTFLQGSIEARVKMKVESTKKISDIISYTERSSSREEPLFRSDALSGVFKEVNEGDEYPITTYIPTNQRVRCAKYGEVIEVTEEMIYFDQTSELNRAVDKLAQKAIRTKDDLVLEALIDGENIKNATGGIYTSTIGNLGKIALTEAALCDRIKSFRLRKDDSGNVIDVAPNVLIVTPENEVLARKLLKDIDYYGVKDSINVVPDIMGASELIVSARLSELIKKYDATVANNSWFLMRAKEAIVYYEVWPLEVFSEQDGDSESGFMKDSLRYKTRFYGGAGVYCKELLDASFL